jgi:hypothetical protein
MVDWHITNYDINVIAKIIMVETNFIDFDNIMNAFDLMIEFIIKEFNYVIWIKLIIIIILVDLSLFPNFWVNEI